MAPRVRGLIAEVLVRDNQRVATGQPLVRIDAEEFDARLASAEAELQDATAKVAAARAALTSLDAEEKLAESNVGAARTAIASTDAQNVRARADRARYDHLVASGAVAQRDADLYRAGAATAQSEADHSRAELLVSRDQAAVVRARRPDLQAALAEAQAGVARARAALDLARQDQGHALIRAPIAGVVGDRQVQVGDYVQPGTRLLSLVPIQSMYVTANFKETQTARMLVGQPAMVKVDALPGHPLYGRVESFAPGSGSEFSLLPYEPGTGNFTKIVQRVPVRIPPRSRPARAGAPQAWPVGERQGRSLRPAQAPIAPALAPDLPRPAHHVLVGGELFGPHRTAGMQLVGGDADLGAEAELATVGELG